MSLSMQGGIPMQAQAMVPVPMAETSTNGLPQQNSGISADEIALYDRQIRLWGMQAQEKIRSADVLLISMKALANEIAKNLVLAGINSLTIIDHEAVKPTDLGAQFFLSEEEGHIGMNRAEAASGNVRKLNPRVKVYVDKGDIRTKGPSYFQPFHVVIATDLDPDSLNLINTATRLNGKPFYAAGTHGFYGYIFSDLIEHDYVIQRDEPNVATHVKAETRTRSVVDVATRKEGGKTVERVTKRELYSTWTLADAASLPEEYRKSPRRLRAVTPALSCLRALWEFQQEKGGSLPTHTRADLERFTTLANQKHGALSLPSATLRSEFLRGFLQGLGSEVAPVTAVLGGQLAQDVINVLGRTQQPIQNMVIFDGNTMEASMYPLHPEDESLGKGLLASGSAADIVVAAATAAATDNGFVGSDAAQVLGMVAGAAAPGIGDVPGGVVLP